MMLQRRGQQNKLLAEFKCFIQNNNTKATNDTLKYLIWCKKTRFYKLY